MDSHPGGGTYERPDPASPDYFQQVFQQGQRKRAQIVDRIQREARPGDDIEWLTASALYDAGLISASELHATGSANLLPKGWYYHYVNDDLGYCPTRVWGLNELPPDEATTQYYRQGFRWMTVFSQITGPRGDSTFVHSQTFPAQVMTEHRLNERSALAELAHLGYPLHVLPAGIQIRG